MNYETQIKEWLFADDSMMGVLRAVRDLELPDCWIGAGFLRNKVWDELHNSQYRSLFDIDVIYFEEGGSEAEEHEQIARLKTEYPKVSGLLKTKHLCMSEMGTLLMKIALMLFRFGLKRRQR